MCIVHAHARPTLYKVLVPESPLPIFHEASSCSQVMSNSLLAPASVHSLETAPGNACRFLSLPHELIVEVLKYLPVQQILQIDIVSRTIFWE